MWSEWRNSFSQRTSIPAAFIQSADNYEKDALELHKSAAYERTSVIVTTNLPFEQWTEVLGSQRLTGAVLDRLTHHCHILEATGDSYRLKDARKRVSRSKKSSLSDNADE